MDKIFLVEDDSNIRELVAYALGTAGFEAKGFERPSEFWAEIETEKPRLILLDIMLPEEDGLQILRRLREDKALCNIPVMMLTAKGTEYDKVLGLDCGADDYMTKPFGMLELISRIKALLRRTEKAKGKNAYEIGALKVLVDKHQVFVNGEPVLLTIKEFELLLMLMKEDGAVVGRERLLNEVWGYTFAGESRTVDVHVRSLRIKLGDAGDLVETVRGVGYKIGGLSSEN